jgi:hypothetical protein
MRAESLRKVCEAFDELSGDVMVTIKKRIEHSNYDQFS